MTWISRLLLPLIMAMVGESSEVFKIGLDEMKSLVVSGKLGRLEEVLKMEGALAVTGLPEDYEAAVKGLKISAPKCLEEEGMPEFELMDGSLRRTFARSSSSSQEDMEEFPECIRKDSQVISRTFDGVYEVVAGLFTKVAGDKNLNWKSTNMESPGNLTSLLQKEHIHVYRPTTHTSDQDYVVPFHYDSGLLLMLTSFDKHPLIIRNKEGEEVSTADVGDDAMLVLVARGLTDWLLEGTSSSSKFYAVPHAVPTLATGIPSRTVFARMKVVPLDAQPFSIKEDDGRKKYQLFGDFFHDMSSQSNMELCPIMRPEASALQLAWEDLKSSECVGNTAYCWMNCLDIPEPCSSMENTTCFNSENKPCCTDPDHTDDCVNMDGTCHWSCPASQTTPRPPDVDPPFCNGYGTDMYMTGFQASGQAKNPCVILLFESWILNTRVKFFFACIGVILLGILIEYLLCLRRDLQSLKILIRLRNPWRKISIIFLFALNIATGYFAMLVAMTYSVELFLCMVIGLVLGHAVFNSSAPVGESVDPCCASQVVVPPKQEEC